MTILNETARLVKDKMASEYRALTVERVMIGMFFSAVKLSNCQLLKVWRLITRTRMSTTTSAKQNDVAKLVLDLFFGEF